MALQIGEDSIFDNTEEGSLFPASPEDGQVGTSQGTRVIPENLSTGISTNQPKSPGTMADDATIGTVTWSNPDNAKVSDNSYARAHLGDIDNNLYDYEVKIVKSNDTIGSENKAKVALWPYADGDFTYGASDDLWSETWSAEDINNPNFGVVLSARESGGPISHYLKATNFGFSIPIGATIDGIIVEIEKKYTLGDADESFADVDHIEITVYYTT